jgi:hypothetical protein
MEIRNSASIFSLQRFSVRRFKWQTHVSVNQKLIQHLYLQFRNYCRQSITTPCNDGSTTLELISSLSYTTEPSIPCIHQISWIRNYHPTCVTPFRSRIKPYILINFIYGWTQRELSPKYLYTYIRYWRKNIPIVFNSKWLRKCRSKTQFRFLH